MSTGTQTRSVTGTIFKGSTVLFVDERDWGCFFQLEAGLRRAGYRTVRVTLSAPGLSRHLCFDRTVHVDSPSDLDRLPAIVARENIVDVQVVDSLALPTYQHLSRIPGFEIPDHWGFRTQAVDKYAASQMLRRHGLWTPDTVLASASSPKDVVAALGLPVVHKPRTGSGGQGVSLVRTLDELHHKLSDQCCIDNYFFEQFIEGRHLQFAGVVDEGRLILGVTYETLLRRDGFGPAVDVACIEDADLAQTGLQAAASLGINGMVNINVIKDAHGRYLVHDVNPRVWGSFTAFRGVQLDFLAAYVDWLQGTERTSCRQEASVRTRLQVFPGALDGRQATRVSGGTTSRSGFVRTALPYLRWVGSRYVAYETTRHLRRRFSRSTRRFDRRQRTGGN
jgi:hypothetical protein